MQRHLSIVTAHGDDGRLYTLYIYSNPTPTQTRMAPHLRPEDSIEIATADGQLVRRRAKGLYELVLTGVLLRSNAPDAL